MASENSRFLYASSWVQRLLYGKSIPARFLPFLTASLQPSCRPFLEGFAANLLFIAFAPSIRMRFAFYSQVPFIACYKPFQLFAFVSPYLFTFSPPRVALWPSLPPSRAFLAPRLRHKKRLKLYAPACYKPFKYLPIVSLSPLLPAPLLACLYLFSTAQAPIHALTAFAVSLAWPA